MRGQAAAANPCASGRAGARWAGGWAAAPALAVPRPPTHRCCLPNSCCRLSAATGEGGGGPTPAGSMLLRGAAGGGTLGPHCCTLSCCCCWASTAGIALQLASAATMRRLNLERGARGYGPSAQTCNAVTLSRMHRNTKSCCAHGADFPRQRALKRSMLPHGAQLGDTDLPDAIFHCPCMLWKTSSSSSTHSQAISLRWTSGTKRPGVAWIGTPEFDRA